MFFVCFKKVKPFERDMASSRMVIMDGNLALSTIDYILDVCKSARVPGKITVLLVFIKMELQNNLRTDHEKQQICEWEIQR